MLSPFSYVLAIRIGGMRKFFALDASHEALSSFYSSPWVLKASRECQGLTPVREPMHQKREGKQPTRSQFPFLRHLPEESTARSVAVASEQVRSSILLYQVHLKTFSIEYCKLIRGEFIRHQGSPLVLERSNEIPFMHLHADISFNVQKLSEWYSIWSLEEFGGKALSNCYVSRYNKQTWNI